MHCWAWCSISFRYYLAGVTPTHVSLPDVIGVAQWSPVEDHQCKSGFLEHSGVLSQGNLYRVWGRQWGVRRSMPSSPGCPQPAGITDCFLELS